MEELRGRWGQMSRRAREGEGLTSNSRRQKQEQRETGVRGSLESITLPAAIRNHLMATRTNCRGEVRVECGDRVPGEMRTELESPM